MAWGPPESPEPPQGGPARPGLPDRHGPPTWPGLPLPPGIPPGPYGAASAPPAEAAGVPSAGPAGALDGDEPAAEGDPFTLAELRTRAAVSAPWWAGTGAAGRRRALAPHLLMLPDHTWWAYGAWARWYRWHPSDTRWRPCPPPAAVPARRSAVPPGPGIVAPPVPAEILPAAHDAGAGPRPPRAVAGRAAPAATADRLREVVAQAALSPAADHPLGWSHFLHATPSTVAAAWSVMLWCASVPLFDSGTENDLVDVWRLYLAPPLTRPKGRFHWLTPPRLRNIAGLYAERLRAGRPDAASEIARSALMTAQVLRDDPCFEPRATALQSILEPILTVPGIDHPAIPHGDEAMERLWSTRCPPALAPVLFADTAPGPNFQFAFYDLAEALRPMCGDPADETGFVEPRHAAVSLLAADLDGYRPDLATPIGDWLDPELRGLLAAVLREPDHELRALWPSQGRPSEALRPVDAEAALTLLGAAAAADFAWCRLAHDVPVPAGGFAVPGAYAPARGD